MRFKIFCFWAAILFSLFGIVFGSMHYYKAWVLAREGLKSQETKMTAFMPKEKDIDSANMASIESAGIEMNLPENGLIDQGYENLLAGEYRESYDLFHEYLKNNTASRRVEFFENLTRVLMLGGTPDLSLVDSFGDIESARFNMPWLMAILLFQEGDYEEAKIAFTRALLLDKKNSDIYRDQGKNFLLLRDYRKSIKAFEKAIKYQPKNAEVFALRGMALAMNNDLEKSNTSCEMALKLNKNNSLGYTCKGFFFMLNEDFGSAMSQYDQALEINPNDGMAHFGKDGLLRMMGN